MRKTGRPSAAKARKASKEREARRAALAKTLNQRPPMRWLDRLIGVVTKKGKNK